MSSAIAIVGMACCYPDARNPRELWENVLAQRRAFRRLPRERLRLQDYFSSELSVPDAIYASEAAVIEGYEFDRVRFRVAGPTFRSVDLAHWLALDVADQALNDAGFSDGRGLPLDTTGVLVGNTLTGEFSRAATLRLRWPYVRRVLEARLDAEDWSQSRRSEFLGQLEEDFKAPFPVVGEESLAGALSNTIAGRICNHFHFGGGGYTVDGACSSSLLAVARSCSALESGELDAALAGGVDLSLDPFELVGFAKAGALAHGEMRIYDKESTGFLPGEGSGFVVLMRLADAVAQRLRIYAVIRGWGISSDGGGGITRPETRGQILALERAYQRAQYGLDSVALIEGHGTGTPVGDEVELRALSSVRRAAGGKTRAAAIGSIKANFGHTKAAAGIAGLIKATLAVHHQLLPATTGVHQPRPEVEDKNKSAELRILTETDTWPADMPIRAGVNSFGFGGINVHVTIEDCNVERRAGFSATEKRLAAGTQDTEVFFLDAVSPAELLAKIERLADVAPNLSHSELADVSNLLASQVNSGLARCAIVAATPNEFEERLLKLNELLRSGETRYLDITEGIFLGVNCRAPRIGLLFPGQASPVRMRAGIHGQRFEEIAELYRMSALPEAPNGDSTAVAQLSIITAEIAGLRLLEWFGIEAEAAVGHSLGELAAYCWAEALKENSLLDLVRLRGAVMSQPSRSRGSMASIGAGVSDVEALILESRIVEEKQVEGKQAVAKLEDYSRVAIACVNSARQTVISGECDAIASLVAAAEKRGWTVTLLSTADAFHSPLMVEAQEPFRKGLANIEFGPLRKTVLSTITGAQLGGAIPLRGLLVDQLTNPVQFMQAISEAERTADLFIEVGPGSVLTHLSSTSTRVPTISLDIGGSSLSGLFQALGAAFVSGSPVKLSALFKTRFARPFDLNHQPGFFVNPCELAPIPVPRDNEPGLVVAPKPQRAEQKISQEKVQPAVKSNSGSAAQLVRTLIAKRAELPWDSIAENARLLRDLHLNSIVVGEIVASAARELGLRPPSNPLSFADATVSGLAQALEQMRNSNSTAPAPEIVPAGIDNWYRAFLVDWMPQALPDHPAIKATASGNWKIVGPPGHPLFESLSRAALPGNGVAVCMSAAPIEEQIDTLLAGAHHAILMNEPDKYFAVLGPPSIAGAFARTLNMEHSDIRTRAIELSTASDAVRYLRAELSASQAHIEAKYDSARNRYERCFRLLPPAEEDSIRIQRGDVVLVSGGAQGITAECALALAKETGATLALLGRSGRENPAVCAHMRALEESGVVANYIQADVTDPLVVKVAVGTAEQTLGPIVGIIHGAGHNQPSLLVDLNESKLRTTFAAKVRGFRNLVAAVDTERLRLLVAFSSVIGRVGLRGQADYALANASLSALTEEFAQRNPQCRCLAFESSAWSGIGMAEKLGKVEALRATGVVSIPPSEGVLWFRKLIAQKLPATSVVVSGRLGPNPPVPMASAQLPLLRFLERPRVHYPGVELIVEADLSTVSDPYLLDHIFRGQPLLPAVMGIEAMVQVAAALHASDQIPAVEDLRLDHPIAVEPGTRVTLRIAALEWEDGRIDLAIRSSTTSFQLDHFRCSCVFGQTPLHPEHVVPAPEPSRLPVDPQSDLYGSLLFQGPRFQRLAGYRRLNAHLSWADLAPASQQAWFNPYLPAALVLGDAAMRDAALHSIQSCVPDSVLLPVGADRISLARLNGTEPVIAHASERWQEGNTYCYDLELRSSHGSILEYWKGLRFRKVDDARTQDWPDPLASALLEWRVRRDTPAARVFAAFERATNSNEDRRRRTERAIQRTLDAPRLVRWRTDGKPLIDAPFSISAAHSNGLTLAVAAQQLVACDIEPVCTRSDVMWRDLLGHERWLLAQLIANQAQEDLQTAATRVWTAVETLMKSEILQDGPLVLLSASFDKKDGVTLGTPGATISTSVVRFRGDSTPFAVAVLSRSEACAITSIGTESALKKQTS